MSDSGQRLPPGWAEARAGDLVGDGGLFCDGDWVESKDQDPRGDIRLIQLADVGDGEYRDRSSRFLTPAKAAELRCTFLQPGDLLVARMPEPLGRACVFPGDAKASVTVVDVCVIRLASPVHPRWLMHQFNAPQMRQRVAALQSGSTRQRISRANLAKISFPLPPLPEQERIAAVTDELFSDLDAGVAALERVREKLKLYRASVLKAAVEGALTADWRKQHPDIEPATELLQRVLVERRRRWEEEQLRKFEEKCQEPPKNWKAKYKEPVAPDTTNLPSLPEGWCWASVEELGDYGEQTVLTGPFGTNLGRSDFVDNGVPLLTIGCLTWGGISLDKAEFITPRKAEELRRYQLRTGDLLFSRMASVGRAGYITSSIEGALFNYHLMRLRFAPDAVKPPYFLFYVQGSGEVVRYIKEVNHGATRDGINTAQLLRLPVAFAPIAEQEAIVETVEDEISVIEHLQGDLDAKLKSVQALRQAILRQAFTGKLVPQDPNDEPASELLKRIAVEREARVREAAAAKGSNRNNYGPRGGQRRTPKVNQTKDV